MRYMQCKCGDCQCWTSMGSPSCRICSKCGSTLAEGPNSHVTPTQHRFLAAFVGGKIEIKCAFCHTPGRIEQAENRETLAASLNCASKEMTEG